MMRIIFQRVSVWYVFSAMLLFFLLPLQSRGSSVESNLVKLSEVYLPAEGTNKMRPLTRTSKDRNFLEANWTNLNEKVEPIGAATKFHLSWASDPAFPAYVLEISFKSDFPIKETVAFLVKGNESDKITNSAKKFYWRVIGVSESQELTYPSDMKLAKQESSPIENPPAEVAVPVVESPPTKVATPVVENLSPPSEEKPFLPIPESKSSNADFPVKNRFNDPKKNFLSLGMGMGWMHFRENVSAGVGSVFSNIAAPALALEGDFPLYQQWYLNALFERVPGKAEEPNIPSVQGTTFALTNLIVSSEYHFKPLKTASTDSETHFVGIFSLSRLESPFIYLDQVGTPRLQKASFWNFGFGAGIVRNSDLWRLAAKLQYRYPFRASFASELFSLAPNYIIDASFSADYWLSSKWSIGGKFNARFYDYGFSYPVSGTTNTGKTSIFNTTEEIRIGMSF